MRNALNKVLVLFLNDVIIIREACEDAIVQVVLALKLSVVVTMTIRKPATRVAANPWYAAKILKQVVKKLLNDLLFTSRAPPS